MGTCYIIWIRDVEIRLLHFLPNRFSQTKQLLADIGEECDVEGNDRRSVSIKVCSIPCILLSFIKRRDIVGWCDNANDLPCQRQGDIHVYDVRPCCINGDRIHSKGDHFYTSRRERFRTVNSIILLGIYVLVVKCVEHIVCHSIGRTYHVQNLQSNLEFQPILQQPLKDNRKLESCCS